MTTSLTTKAGNSAGAKKGWKSRLRGGMMKVGATLGSMHPTLPPKIKNQMRKDAGMRPLTPRKKPTRPAHVSKADWKKMDADDREMADLFVSKSVTTKAGTSAGAKLGWQHRLAGRLGKVIGAWHGGVAGAGIGTAVAGPLGSVLGFAGGARVGMKFGGRVGTRVSLGISKIKTGNKRIIAAGAKMLARGFKKSAEQKYGSTFRAGKSAIKKVASLVKSGGTVDLGRGRTATFGSTKEFSMNPSVFEQLAAFTEKHPGHSDQSVHAVGRGRMAVGGALQKVANRMSGKLRAGERKGLSKSQISNIEKGGMVGRGLRKVGKALTKSGRNAQSGALKVNRTLDKDSRRVGTLLGKKFRSGKAGISDRLSHAVNKGGDKVYQQAFDRARGKEAITTKAGTSAGAKKGWLSRGGAALGRHLDRSLGQKYGVDRAGAKKAIDKATSQPVARGLGKLLGRTITSVPRKIKTINKRNISGAGKAAKGLAKLGLRAVKHNVQGIASFGRGVGEGVMGKSTDSFSVKQVGDNYRWFAVSSTAFIDKDRQIVTTAALQRDVELSETLKESQGDYGPLRFWHVGIPGGPGLDLGRCDFRLMIGRSLIESGTFVSKEIGQRAKELADELELSIGFRHPKSEPGRDGLFHNTLTLERSLLPSSKGSNLLTTFAVS